MLNRCTESRWPNALPRTALCVLAIALALPTMSCTGGEIGALPANASTVARTYAGECDEGVASSCFALALQYTLGIDAGHGIAADAERAERLRRRACDGGHEPACIDSALSAPPSD